MKLKSSAKSLVLVPDIVSVVCHRQGLKNSSESRKSGKHVMIVNV